MPRPALFNPQEATDKALLLFWRKGYQAAAMSELLIAMNLSRSSFYAAFGDKRSLFIECLRIFGERTRQVLTDARVDMSPLDALQFFFERHLLGKPSQNASLGCLLVNTVLELSDVDDELSEIASQQLAQVQQTFETCLRDAGCTPKRSQDLAAVLMLLNEGVRVASRRRLSSQEQSNPIAITFAMLRQEIQASIPH